VSQVTLFMLFTGGVEAMFHAGPGACSPVVAKPLQYAE